MSQAAKLAKRTAPPKAPSIVSPDDLTVREASYGVPVAHTRHELEENQTERKLRL